MILSSLELNEFIVEPWMELESFDPKLIKKIQPNHPYKILLWLFYKYNPSYSNWNENDANPDCQGYNDDVVDFYFRMLDDYNRYGIAFYRDWNLFPDNKLGVFEEKDFGKSFYSLIDYYDKKETLLLNKVKTMVLKEFGSGKKPLSEEEKQKKTLLFNKVKTIDLKEYDRGKKPLSEEEIQKRDIIKKQSNKKLQVALMDPDVYRSIELMKHAIKKSGYYIEKFNHRMTWWGIKEFKKIEFDI